MNPIAVWENRISRGEPLNGTSASSVARSTRDRLQPCRTAPTPPLTCFACKLTCSASDEVVVRSILTP
jgi:hypothetical protein